MALGISFGKKKASETAVTNQLQNTSQNQNTTTSGSQTTSATGTQTGSETSQVDSVLNQLENQTQQTQQSQQTQQTGVTQSLSDRLLGGLESAAMSLLGGLGLGTGNSPASQATNAQIAQLGGINVNDYVANAQRTAQAMVQPQLDSTINQMSNQSGGTPDANSMTAILANQLRGTAATQVQSAMDQALLNATQGLTQGIGATTAADTTSANILNTLLGALTQGRQQTTQTGQAAVTGTTGTTGTQQQAGTQLSAQQSQQQTQQLSQVLTALQELLSSTGTSQTFGTSNTTGSTGGGGFSLGI